MVDLMVSMAKQSGKRITYTRTCRTGLYGLPGRLMAYVGTWMTMNENRIVKDTFKFLTQETYYKRACGMRVPNMEMMLTNYKGCVTNTVNVIYREIAVDMEDMSRTYNSRQITANTRSYLKSVLAAKYMCAPRGRAQKYQFANQDMCLRELVGYAHDKWVIR